MEDMRESEDKPQDEVKAELEKPEISSKELSETELNNAAGGGETFTSVSNVLKLRHDTAKNSISNVR